MPTKVCKSLHIDNLRVYLAANRLFTITGYKGYDPATGATSNSDSGTTYMGIDDALYPLSRSYMIGLKFGFYIKEEYHETEEYIYCRSGT